MGAKLQDFDVSAMFTFARNINLRHILSSVVTDSCFVHTHVLLGELGAETQQSTTFAETGHPSTFPVGCSFNTAPSIQCYTPFSRCWVLVRGDWVCAL